MASSRIFIKGLPPTITVEEFKKHFSKIAAVTDVKLISHRRIGYIGYQTEEDAAKSVKYFNRTFIRMSRISVETARPILEPSSPSSKNAVQESDKGNPKNINPEVQSSAARLLNQGVKRKRSDIDESQYKLKEFLEVMQPTSKNKVWAPQDSSAESDLETKVQAFKPIVEQGEHENEKINENFLLKTNSGDLELTSKQIPQSTALTESSNGASKSEIFALTDDEWVRVRTNRLLDLQVFEKTAQTLSETAPKCGFESRNIETAEVPILSEETYKKLPVLRTFCQEEIDTTLESIKKHQRLFVRNLPYTATEEDLKHQFSPFGAIKEIHISVDVSGKSKGFAHIQFAEPTAAIEAFSKLDGKPFQGRLLHIIPGYAKREEKFDDQVISKLPFIRQKQIKKKTQAASASFSWNSLYMDQDAVNSAIASRLGVSKADMLDPTSADSAWKQALAETSIIQESRAYFTSKGVDLNSFKKRERGDKAILVKNLPYGTTSEDLRIMFEKFGQVTQILIPPSGTIAIVEFSQPGHTKAAFANLSYRRVKDLVLFLEKAPKSLFISVNENTSAFSSDFKPNLQTDDQKVISVSDLLEQETSSDSMDHGTLFVRNLNFSTTNERLAETFKPLTGFVSARVCIKKDPKKPGQVLSMGFGFLEFKCKEEALSALKAMNGYNLDGHNLVIKLSHKGLDFAEERRKEDKLKKNSAKKTKIIIKNLPFEATKRDVRILFGAYGKLRSVRLPKKFNQSTRGFAFADFVNSREAESALEALKNTHLLGRRLILEFAAAESLDAEEEIEKMQKKVSSQVNKVALQKLTGGGRKKFNMEGDENED